MFVTDAQIHVYRPDTPERRWRRGSRAPGGTPSFDIADAIRAMDAAQVDRAVLVPPLLEDGRNDLALSAAAEHPRRFAVMGLFPTSEHHDGRLRTWREQPGMLGIRLSFPGGAAAETLSDDTWKSFFAAANAEALPLMIFAPGNNESIGRIARRFPDLPIILDHLNIATHLRGAEITRQVATLQRLADCPNVAAKISALPNLVDEGYPYHSLQRHVRRVVRWFGADRCMWGSDLSRLRGPYADWRRAVAEEMTFLTPDEREQIMSRTLERWLGWPVAR